MLNRYNIMAETETTAAFAKADAYLSAQPVTRNLEEGQFGASGTDGVSESLKAREGGWLLR
jgi:hypothetical protein